MAGDGWVSLFDGKSLEGWKVGANAGSFAVQDGAIVVNGEVAHLFYVGDVGNHSFKNFEFKSDVMTLPGSNSGIYFHTEYQQSSWPKKGYEVQVNNSHTDWIRSGSLWGILNIRETYAKDNEWYTQRIVVEANHIRTYVNDQLVADYIEKKDEGRNEGMEQRRISSGTFALQGHDPKSKVLFKNIMVKILP